MTTFAVGDIARIVNRRSPNRYQTGTILRITGNVAYINIGTHELYGDRFAVRLSSLEHSNKPAKFA